MLIPCGVFTNGVEVKIDKHKCSKCEKVWSYLNTKNLQGVCFCGESFELGELKNRECAFKLDFLQKLDTVQLAVNTVKKYFEEEGLFTGEKKIEAPKKVEYVSFGFGECDFSKVVQVLNLTEDEYDFLKLIYDNENGSWPYSTSVYIELEKEGIVHIVDFRLQVKVPCWVCPCNDGTVKLFIFQEKSKDKELSLKGLDFYDLMILDRIERSYYEDGVNFREELEWKKERIDRLVERGFIYSRQNKDFPYLISPKCSLLMTEIKKRLPGI